MITVALSPASMPAELYTALRPCTVNVVQKYWHGRRTRAKKCIAFSQWF